MNKARILTGIIFLIGLTGCATPPQGPQTSVNLSAQIEALKAVNIWELKGKMAIRNNEEAVSANVKWQTLVDDYHFRLTNFLGVTLVDMNVTPNLAVLQADGEHYQDSDANRLIYQVTGWDIPLEELQNWIKGVPGKYDTYTLTDKGLLATLNPGCRNCTQWQVVYGDYQQVDNVWLPHKLTLNQRDSDNFIKIQVRSWTLTTH